MVIRQFVALWLSVSLLVVGLLAQNAENVKNDRGRQGAWKIWLTRSLEESTDSLIAPYYRYVTYTDGEESGPFTDHYRSGSVYRKGRLIRVGKRAVPDGIVELYRESGSLKARETYYRGKRTGLYTKYAISGAMTLEGEFDEDRRVGIWTTFYETGQVKSRGNYVDNNQDGEWVTFSDDGRVKETALYSDGKLIDWAALLDLCEKTQSSDRITDALRYWEQARTSIYTSMGPTSLPAGRLHMARCRIAWIQGNASLSFQQLDTALQIYQSAGDAGRIVYQDAIQKILEFAHEQYAATLLTRLNPVLIDIMDNDTTLRYSSFKRLLRTSYRGNVVIEDHSLLRRHVQWASTRLPKLATAEDTEYTKDMYTIWNELLTSSFFMHEYTLQAQCRREAEALPGLHNNSDIHVLRIRFLPTRAMDIFSDSVTTWQEKKNRLLMFLDECRDVSGLTYGSEYATVAGFGIQMTDTAFIHAVLNKVPKSGVVATDYTKHAIASHHVWLYLAEQNCDSARKYLEEVRLLGISLKSQKLYDRYKEAVDECGHTDLIRTLPEVDTLRTSKGEINSLSLRDLLTTVFTKDAPVYVAAITEGATSEQRLLALLLVDSIAPLPSHSVYLDGYSQIRQKVRTTVENRTSPVDKAEALFRVLHDSVLTKYVGSIPLRRVFENGQYNCASAVALYSLLCNDFGIPITYYKSPGHIACGIPDKSTNSVIPVELLAPEDGFGFIKHRDSLIAHLLTFKLITNDEMDELGVDSIFRQYYEHTQLRSFESLLSVVSSNALSRAYIGDKEFNEHDYVSIIRTTVLDSSRSQWSLLYGLLPLTLDSSLAGRFIRDVRYMAAYFSGQRHFTIMVLPLLARLGVVAQRNGDGVSVERAFQSFYDYTEKDSSGLALRQLIQKAYAGYRLGVAMEAGHSDTAYAYYRKCWSDRSLDGFPGYDRVVRAYADDCIEDRAYSTALNVVEEYFQNVATPAAQSDLVQVSSKILQSYYVSIVDSSKYRRIVRLFMKEYLLMLPDRAEQANQLKFILEKAVFWARHELGTIAIAEAKALGFAKDDLVKIESVHNVILQNRSRVTSMKGVTYSIGLYLGEINGPVTMYIPAGKTLVFASVTADGLEPGQQFALKVSVKSSTTSEHIIFDHNVGAVDEITYCYNSFSAYRASLTSKATILVYVNGKKVLSQDYDVR
ncbi:MAG: toxin-antitoxin system YwqK family antitoxin [Ignavibacteria bacterium]|nr:toxin-antitoxin system YwqK family antitoxin [Ignavibacteria bacterium]